MNSFIEGLTSADIVTTVSKTYGKEAQLRNGEFGNGMHDHVKLAAFNKKLYGIVNGNSNGFNPAKDPILQNWTSVLPETHGQKVDLRFGPHLSNEELAEQTKKIQRELCAYLKQLDPTNPAYANLDPEKPIVMYLGRYDISQKGVDKFKLIMEETLANGGQFICVGTEPDDESKAILHKMKEIAKQRNHQGVLILEDRKVDGQYVYQGVFGSLLRGGCTHAIFPSIYEPCGLVQGEFNRFKKKVIAPDTGGFPDTLKKEGPDANAYLFKRCDVWYSQEQDEAIKETLRTAIAQAVQEQRILYHGTPQERAPQMEHERRIMQNAIKSTWETTPDGSLSAIRLLELVYAKGFQTLRNRGKIFADLKTVSF